MENTKDENNKNLLFRRQIELGMDYIGATAKSLGQLSGVALLASMEQNVITSVAELVNSGVANSQAINFVGISLGALMVRDAVSVIGTEYTKSKQLQLEQETKQKIADEGIYHFTSKECAESIVNCGYYVPTKGVIRNHFSKSEKTNKFSDLVYMFAGRPSTEAMIINLDVNKTGDFYAVRHRPDQYDINNYRQRLEDGAITHEGRLDIAHNKPEIVRMGVFLEDGKLCCKEIDFDADYRISEEARKQWKKQTRTYNSFFGKGFKDHIVGALGKAITYDKNLHDEKGNLKNKINIARFRNGQKKQLENETERQYYSYVKDNTSCLITQGEKEIVDGKELQKYILVKTDKDSKDSVVQEIYTDDFKPKELGSNNMIKFFKSAMDNIDERAAINYIGKPILNKETGNIDVEYDEDYLVHVQNRNESKKIADKNEEEYKRQNSKVDKFKRFLKQIYDKVPKKDMDKAYGVVKTIKERNKTKELSKTDEENDKEKMTNDDSLIL